MILMFLNFARSAVSELQRPLSASDGDPAVPSLLFRCFPADISLFRIRDEAEKQNLINALSDVDHKIGSKKPQNSEVDFPPMADAIQARTLE